MQAMRQSTFIQNLDEKHHEIAARMLKVAKASYLLRDNDNLYLGKVRAGVTASEQEIRKRIAEGRVEWLDKFVSDQATSNTFFTRHDHQKHELTRPSVLQLPRQLVGQPAGPGVSSGLARVLVGENDLADFKRGEVLICDAIEPNMTFLAPLAAAIIERRGGMLIHGAIIAREYGIPCVTGIPDAVSAIQSGDFLTVDGYLGVVTIERKTN